MLTTMWYSGTTSSCVIGFLAKDLFDRSSAVSKGRSGSPWLGRTEYTSRWPWRVPTSSVSPALEIGTFESTDKKYKKSYKKSDTLWK